MQLLPPHKDLGWKPFAWIIYIAFFVVFPVLKPHTTPLEWVATIAATLLFLVLYFRGYWARDRELAFIVVAMTALGVAFFPTNGGGGSFYIYAASFAAWLQPRRRAIWSIAAIEAVVIAQTLVLRIHPFYAFWPVVFTLIVGALNLQEQLDNAANARLRLAHDEISHLAKVAERERIARDLHDTLLQGMQGLIWRFQAASDRIPPGEPARQLLEQSLDRADKLLEESRDKVKDLRPMSGAVADLAQALAAEGEQLTKLHSAQFRVSVQGAPRDLHPIVREEGFLIGREALANAFNHSAAANIEAEVTYGEHALQIRIRDDGRGISETVLDAGGRPGHFGLLGMRERAKQLGANIEVWSKPGAGTEIDVRVPAEVAYRPSQAATRGWRFRLGAAS